MSDPDRRVAFAGVSGTGKSTLARAIAERCGLPLNPVGARSVAEAMGYASPYDVDRAGRRAEFQQRLLAEKVAWEREHDAFVTDRTPLDNLLYTALHDVAAIDESILGAARCGVRRYTHVVYCCLDAFQNLDSDPARVGSRAYHEIYDGMIRGLVAKYVADHIPVLFLFDGDREVRERAVFEFIHQVDPER